MPSIEQALLIELFGLLVIVFAGLTALMDGSILGGWDVIGDMTVWMVTGLLIGVYGLVTGVRSPSGA